MVMWGLGLHALGMVQGLMLQLTLVPDVDEAGWRRTIQFLLNSYGRNLTLG